MRIINVYINAPNLLIIQYICTKKNKRKKKTIIQLIATLYNKSYTLIYKYYVVICLIFISVIFSY